MNLRAITENLSNLNFTAIDFETANRKRDSLCSVGIVRIENGKLVDEFCQLIRPSEFEFDFINQQIHKIDIHSLETSPALEEVWHKILPYFENQLLVAHNAAFDISVLENSLSNSRINIPDFKYLCSQKLAQHIFADLNNYRLKDVADYLGFEFVHHDALWDARVCSKIALETLPKIEYEMLNFNSPELTYYISKVASKDKIDPFQEIFGHKDISSDLLKQDLTGADESNFFYDKKVVFTGDLKNYTRQEAAQIIQGLGADVNTGVSRKTNIIVTGERPGKSKLSKAEKLINDGYEIKIINEDEFITYINQ